MASDIVGLALPWPVAFAAEVLGPVRGEFLAELAYAFGMLAMAPALLFLAPVLIFAVGVAAQQRRDVELVDRPAILELVDARPPFIRSDRFWFVMILVFGEAAYSDPSEERCYRLTVENSTVRTVRLSGGERRTD